MSDRRRRWRVSAVILAFTLLLAACGSSSAPSSAPSSATGAKTTGSAAGSAKPSKLVYAVLSTGNAKVPAFTTAGEDVIMNSEIYDALLQADPKTMKIEPDLATSYQVSPDGKTWTFHLRKGVKWQRGFGAFTCQDVKFTWALNQDPKIHSFWMKQASIVSSVSCPDPNTAVIHLKDPFQGFIWNVVNIQPSTGFILSKAAWDKLGKAGYEKTPVGTGPYMLKSLTPHQDVIMVRNPDYWGPTPKLDEIDFKEVTDYQTAAIAVKTGAIDVAPVDAVTAEQYKNAPGVRLVTKPGMSVSWLEINTTVKPFDKLKVREAMRAAIDYKGLLKTVLRGYGEVGYEGSIFPNVTGFDAAVNPHNTYDPTLAKKLLKEAGVKLPIKGFFSTYNDTLDVNVAQFIAADLAQVGIDLQPRPLERGTLVQVRIQPQTPASVLGTTSSPDPDWIFSHFISSWNPPKGLNIPRYSGIDKFYQEQHFAPTTAARAKYVAAAQKQLAQDVPAIELFVRNDIWLVNKAVTGLEPTVLYSGPPLYKVSLAGK